MIMFRLHSLIVYLKCVKEGQKASIIDLCGLRCGLTGIGLTSAEKEDELFVWPDRSMRCWKKQMPTH